MKFIDVKTDPSSVYRETAMLEFPFTVSKVTDVPPEEECRGGGIFVYFWVVVTREKHETNDRTKTRCPQSGASSMGSLLALQYSL